ncbi:MAG: geranylgeranyl reductase family protein, partial [Candidatus Thorarchaeota archaeon]
MNSNKYDVVVVGAGPGGSTTARVTADAGLKTLLLERRHTVGVPVQCGEFLPIPSEVARMFPNCSRAPHLVDVPKSVIRNRCSQLQLVSPRWREYNFKMLSNVIDRAGFDQHLADTSVDAGAELCLSSRVVGRQGQNRIVYSQDGKLSVVDTQVIIGADGPRSLVAKMIGSNYPRPERDISASIQYVMTGVDCDSTATSMFFGSHIAPGGYAWIIPRSSSIANVGFGARRPFSSDSVPLRAYLERFIQSHPGLRNGSIETRVSASIPVGGPVTSTSVGNVLLVGDAAGHVMSTNGGGIPTALI